MFYTIFDHEHTFFSSFAMAYALDVVLKFYISSNQKFRPIRILTLIRPLSLRRNHDKEKDDTELPKIHFLKKTKKIFF